MKSSFNVRFIFLFVLIFACVLSGCTSERVYRNQMARAQGVMPHNPVDFESPPVLDAEKVLPEDLYESDLHRVRRDVITYGFTNTYRVSSDFGEFMAHGDEMLRTRIQEIKAIAAIQEIKKTDAFADAAENAAKSPVAGVKDLVMHPVDTVTGIPKGLWRYANRIVEMGRGGRGELEDSWAKELVGFSAVKRKFAYELGVDAYSSNKPLQEGLNSVSWAAFSGGMGVNIATSFLPTSFKRFVKAAGTSDKLNKILRDKSPEDLRKMNRELLKEMGVIDEVIGEFLEHPWFSPRHEMLLVNALSNIKWARGRSAFIRLALSAESEEDAFFLQCVAQLMADYHRHVSRIDEIIVVQGLAMGFSKERELILPLLLDYGVWSQSASRMVETILESYPDHLAVKGLEILVTGVLSNRAVLELESRGIRVRVDAFSNFKAGA
jgi:hypothetical protein